MSNWIDGINFIKNKEVIINKNKFPQNSYSVCKCEIGDYVFVSVISRTNNYHDIIQQYNKWRELITMYCVIQRFKTNNPKRWYNHWRDWCLSNEADKTMMYSCTKYFKPKQYHVLQKTLQKCL
eukprot:205580_1